MKKSYDVILVGAGMVGALTANLLAQQGFHVALVDKGNGQCDLSTLPFYDARVSAVSRHSKALMDRAGAWQRIPSERLTPYHNMQVWDGLGRGEIGFSCDDVHLDELGHLVENQVLNQALLAQLETYPKQVDSFFACSVSHYQKQEHGMQVTLDNGQTLHADLLIAADGANSFIRAQAQIETKEWDYQHNAIVATIELSRSHENTAWQSFGEEGILAILPMPSFEGRHFASIVWSVPPEDAKDLLELDNDLFCKRLNYAISNEFEVLDVLTKRLSIPLRQRHALHYVQTGLALVGDAAHTIHPLAGQGANLGFADAGALVDVLIKAKERGESLSNERVLRRYQRNRMSDNIRMSASMEFFKRLYETQNPIAVFARNTGMSWMNKQRLVKNHIITLALG
ncbi:2-octaprenyl-3-methyl-6-methoxy-1,4-benzoquinol hydroxylase [Marinomonas sp. MED121]|uniref:UbiH/UbiF/VisC/COQ6 family ubiquinone biosynthesis hydroxylase n=1 Tax=Marinomonas sp. MED121 TaxID=314277 RepID=UPI0000690A80|nr:UbiH/UbiF/VisC/COQ6 family ubiquinone biosynthesis hydroxylase [Marinomonas sp. MED121]EAQ63090.1 2-octaprenyl-3-methyl-6-methoxy-1,4-benzoquinol hydroxylase [Marinomonas sp. MED121]